MVVLMAVWGWKRQRSEAGLTLANQNGNLQVILEAVVGATGTGGSGQTLPGSTLDGSPIVLGALEIVREEKALVGLPV